MVYWCTSIGITLEKSISYTLASFGRHYSPTTQIHTYVQASIQTLSTYVGGANATNGGSMKLVHILLHIVNMLGQATWIQMNFNSYLCERVIINYQKGEIESSSFFGWIDKTLSANLVYQSGHKIGSTFQVIEQVVKIMMMVWSWWWSSARLEKEEREK